MGQKEGQLRGYSVPLIWALSRFQFQSFKRYIVIPLISLGKKSVDFCGRTSPPMAISATVSTLTGFNRKQICARPESTSRDGRIHFAFVGDVFLRLYRVLRDVQAALQNQPVQQDHIQTPLRR